MRKRLVAASLAAAIALCGCSSQQPPEGMSDDVFEMGLSVQKAADGYLSGSVDAASAYDNAQSAFDACAGKYQSKEDDRVFSEAFILISYLSPDSTHSAKATEDVRYWSNALNHTLETGDVDEEVREKIPNL